MTKPVLYYYFRNKEGIYLELMREGFSRFDSLVGALSRRAGEGARCSCCCLRAFDLFLDRIGVARVMYSIYYGPPQGAPFFDSTPTTSSSRMPSAGWSRKGSGVGNSGNGMRWT